ncbi:helix-turn-helix domain-containing protein [Blastomonas fulva]|jgi:transcriptional regulator with XRE-family HTH domain|uniref:helix-turn-helix domain-containing protein n=1 Tax=Blastomonas fulva TaxID=1550728 RepID=UPI003D269AB8
MDWNAVVASNVRRLRVARKLTQEQLALEAGLDLTYIGGIERGRRNPTVKVLGQIAAVLGTDPLALLQPIAASRDDD